MMHFLYTCSYYVVYAATFLYFKRIPTCVLFAVTIINSIITREK